MTMDQILNNSLGEIIFENVKVPNVVKLIVEYFYAETDWFKNFYITPAMEKAGYTYGNYLPGNKFSLSQAAYSMTKQPLFIGYFNITLMTNLF